MKIIFTKEFRNKAILAENGLKFILHGFALLPKFGADEKDIPDLRLEDIVENYQIITNEKKTGTDLIDKLFDVAYIPTLEVKTNTGERFGAYKFRINQGLNSYATSKGTDNRTDVKIEAIILVGETYTEQAKWIESLHKSYLAAVILPDGDDWDLSGDAEDAKSIVFNLQLSLGLDIPAGTEVTAGYDENFYKPESGPHNQETVAMNVKSTWLVPSASPTMTPYRDKRYRKIAADTGLPQEYVDQIEFIPYTFNLVPVTEKNDAIYNVNARFNIWDNHKDKCVKPQMILSYGEQNDMFEHGEIGFTTDPLFFSMNEKASDGKTNFDLFNREKFFAQSACDGKGNLRIIGDSDTYSASVDNFMFKTYDNDLNGVSGSNIIESRNCNIEDALYVHLYNASNIDASGMYGANLVNSELGKHTNSRNTLGIGNHGRLGTKFYSWLDDAEDTVMIGPNQWTTSISSDRTIFIGHKGLLAGNMRRPPYQPSGGASLANYTPSWAHHSTIIFGKYNANDYRVEKSSGLWADDSYYDNKIVAVGDGFFTPWYLKDPDNYDYYQMFTVIPPENGKDGMGQFFKRLNVFSVESNTYIPYVHFNSYDGYDYNPSAHYAEEASFFAVRAMHTDKDTPAGYYANQLNALYSPDAIYYTKPHADNEQWKIRIKEMANFLSDSYLRDTNISLNTRDIDRALAKGIKGTNTFILPVEPKYHYRFTLGSRVDEGYTKGLCGKFGLKGVYKKHSTTRAEWDLKILEKDNLITQGDLVNMVNAQFNRKIGFDGVNGKDKTNYMMICYNATNANVSIKGIRLRKFTNGYQTMTTIHSVMPAATERVIYMNNGEQGAFGTMNFNFSDGEYFMT